MRPRAVFTLALSRCSSLTVESPLPASIIDASGTLTATYSYDAYGNLQSSIGTLPNAFRYAGEWYDGETGFYYLRARYYDPAVGRFITRDPWPGNLAEPHSLNPYLYVRNRPTLLADPSGLDPAPEWKDLGQGWKARVDQIRLTEGFEIHIHNPQGVEVGIVQGRSGWIGKHGVPAARPPGIPDEVINALNGINVREMRRRGPAPSSKPDSPYYLPKKFLSFKYLNPGRVLSSVACAFTVLSGLFDDLTVMQRAIEQGRTFDKQLMHELVEENPRYLFTPFGVMENPYYREPEMF